jgi:hypothetical protein
MQALEVLCLLSAASAVVHVYTAFRPAAHNALLQRRQYNVAYSCSATPSRVEFRLSLRQLRPTQVWMFVFPLTLETFDILLSANKYPFLHLLFWANGVSVTRQRRTTR